MANVTRLGESLGRVSTSNGHVAWVAQSAVPQFQGMINSIESRGYTINNIGGFSDRNIRLPSGGFSDTPSQHSLGYAMDIGVDPSSSNGRGGTIPDDVMRESAAENGLKSGADWSGAYKDNPHVEIPRGQHPDPSKAGNPDAPEEDPDKKDDPNKKDPSPKKNDKAQKQQGAQGGSGGCGGASASSTPAAAALANNQGFGSPQQMLGMAQAMMSNPTAMLGMLQGQAMGALQGALGGALNSITGGAMSSIMGALGSMGSMVGGGGLGGLAGGLMGMAGSLMQQGVGSVMQGVNQAVGNVFGNGAGPFAGIFQQVMGATASSFNMNSIMTQAASAVFGQAASNGFMNSANISPVIDGVLGGEGATTNPGGPNVSQLGANVITDKLAVPLVGPQDAILNQLIVSNGGMFSPFASSFPDYNAMITQGFGALSKDLHKLGDDLVTLGTLADIADLLRIGMPGQIVNQIIVNGGGITTGIVDQLASKNIPVTSINSAAHDQDALVILNSINTKPAVDAALTALGITGRTIIHLGQLMDPTVLFPTSRTANNFTNLNDIALQLSICGTGHITTLKQLGTLFQQLEVLPSDAAILQQSLLVNYDDLVGLQDAFAPPSNYNLTNFQLTPADFIGTAAGFNAINYLTALDTLFTEVDAVPGLLDAFKDLQVALNHTLHGDYTSGSTITVPTVGSYTFGAYTSLDAAVLDIVTAIADEANTVYTTADETVKKKLNLITYYVDALASQLVTELQLQDTYNVEINQPLDVVDKFTGNGTSTDFGLTYAIDSDYPVIVKVNGTPTSAYTHSLSIIRFSSAPALNAAIEVSYTNVAGVKAADVSAADAYDFVQEMDTTYATQTGVGSAADYLNSVATDDIQGQSMQAVMIQARNRQVAEAMGIVCPGVNRLGAADAFPDIDSFIKRTGIWSAETATASDAWLASASEKTRDQHNVQLFQLERNAANVRNLKNSLGDKLIGQLCYVNGNDVYISQTGNNLFQFLDINVDPIPVIDITAPAPTGGYLLGPLNEILYQVAVAEDLQDNFSGFSPTMSATTQAKLTTLKIDIPKLVKFLQLIASLNIAKIFGMSFSDETTVVGIPSVTHSLITQYAATQPN
jgi:hypothetical protein